MKYILGLLVATLIIGGVIFGFRAGRKQTFNTPAGSVSSSSTTSRGNVLDLSNKGLTRVGADIYNQTSATELILSNNNIRALPTEMGRMNNLISFKIDHNIMVGSLIGEIRQMSKLKQLDVSYNKMTGMPAEIGQLNSLESLNYSYNNITGLPNELANLKNNLKDLILTGNPLDKSQISKIKVELPNTTIVF